MARVKKIAKAKEPVRVRTKKLANGNQSIYLDFYRDGQREYEFLKLYLVPETNETAKVQNHNALNAANAIKAQRIIELANQQAGIRIRPQKATIPLADWIRKYNEGVENSGKTIGKLLPSTIQVLEAFRKGAKLKEVNKSFCLDFIAFLRNSYKKKDGKPLSPTTIKNYITILGCALNKAVRDEIIARNPLHSLSASEKPQKTPSKREFLTIDEVQKLIKTPHADTELKQAFLFACFCGLRISDIRALTWGAIETDSKGRAVCNIVMKKTKAQLYLPLSDKALQWLPPRGNKSESQTVFTLPSSSSLEPKLKRWATNAGITKHVTFHVSRHTYATMLITRGAELYTVSKLLGHTTIQHTEIYAKLLSDKKFEATSLIDNDLQTTIQNG